MLPPKRGRPKKHGGTKKIKNKLPPIKEVKINVMDMEELQANEKDDKDEDCDDEEEEFEFTNNIEPSDYEDIVKEIVEETENMIVEEIKVRLSLDQQQTVFQKQIIQLLLKFQIKLVIQDIFLRNSTIF
jgi:hypothetical protein